MAYSDLTLRERAAVIKAGVKRGYRYLDLIINAYNEFSENTGIDEESPYLLDGEISQEFTSHLNTEPLLINSSVVEQDRAYRKDLTSEPPKDTKMSLKKYK